MLRTELTFEIKQIVNNSDIIPSCCILSLSHILCNTCINQGFFIENSSPKLLNVHISKCKFCHLTPNFHNLDRPSYKIVQKLQCTLVPTYLLHQAHPLLYFLELEKIDAFCMFLHCSVEEN